MIEKLHGRKGILFSLVVILVLLVSCSKKASDSYHIPENTHADRSVVGLAEAGIDPVKIKDLIRGISNRKFKNIDSVLLVKNGTLVLEEYFGTYGPDTLHELHSVSKSVTSILIGIAIDKQMIPGVDSKVYTFFPENKGTRWIDEKYDISLEHVLMMSAGIEWDEYTRPLNDPRNDIATLLFYSDNWINYVLNKKVVEPPGRHWRYSGGLNLLLGGIIRNTTGLYADKFAERYLFDPLGIETYGWHRHPDGTINTQGGLSLSPRDMAKIGYLLLHEGQWGRQQIVSKRWIEDSTHGHITTGSVDYGYQWYRGGGIVNSNEFDAFWAWGRGGQFVFVFPQLDLVAVFTSHPYNNKAGLYRPFLMLNEYILPAILPTPKQSKESAVEPVNLDDYVGKYKWDDENAVISIYREKDRLYGKSPSDEIFELTFEDTNLLSGTSTAIKDFKAVVKRDKTGGIDEVVLYFFPFVKKHLKKIR